MIFKVLQELKQALDAERAELAGALANLEKACASVVQLVTTRDAAIKRAEAAEADRANFLKQADWHLAKQTEAEAMVAQLREGNARLNRVLTKETERAAAAEGENFTVQRRVVIAEALLGRAVAALQMVKANRACSSNTCAMIADAILADATAAQAADTWRAQQEERAELEALALTMRALFMYGATGYTSSIEAVYHAWLAHETKLAAFSKVDARRGSG